MTTTINDGGPAFPTDRENLPVASGSAGMTLRDHFAGLAMVGIFQMVSTGSHGVETDPESGIAKQAYMMADAMLARRVQS